MLHLVILSFLIAGSLQADIKLECSSSNNGNNNEGSFNGNNIYFFGPRDGKLLTLSDLNARIQRLELRTIQRCRLCFAAIEGRTNCHPFNSFSSCSGWSDEPGERWTSAFIDHNNGSSLSDCALAYQWSLECDNEASQRTRKKIAIILNDGSNGDNEDSNGHVNFGLNNGNGNEGHQNGNLNAGDWNGNNNQGNVNGNINVGVDNGNSNSGHINGNKNLGNQNGNNNFGVLNGNKNPGSRNGNSNIGNVNGNSVASNDPRFSIVSDSNGNHNEGSHNGNNIVVTAGSIAELSVAYLTGKVAWLEANPGIGQCRICFRASTTSRGSVDFKSCSDWSDDVGRETSGNVAKFWTYPFEDTEASGSKSYYWLLECQQAKISRRISNIRRRRAIEISSNSSSNGNFNTGDFNGNNIFVVQDSKNVTLTELVERVELLESTLVDQQRCRVCFHQMKDSYSCGGLINSCSDWTYTGQITVGTRPFVDSHDSACTYAWDLECEGAI